MSTVIIVIAALFICVCIAIIIEMDVADDGSIIATIAMKNSYTQ